MLESFFLWLLGVFVIDPAVAEMRDRLGGIQEPAAVMEQLRSCATTAPAALAEKAAASPFWGLSTAIAVAVGITSAGSVLTEATPDCAAAWALLV